MKVLVAKRTGRQPEHHASVRTNDGLFVLVLAAHIGQVAAAADGFHQWIQHHHRFGADALSLLIDGASVGAMVGIADLFAVAAVSLCVVAAQKARYLHREFIFLRVPFFHSKRSFA